MLEKSVGWLNGLFSGVGGLVTWAVGFVTKYAKQLLFIGLILAAGKMLNVKIKV